MDWVPTLLAAAGTVPDPAPPYALDGMNLLPMLAQNAPLVSRKLFWRYKANAQRAARDGDYKFLKILDNTFLFNVVEDPLERANLKERQKDVYQRLAGSGTSGIVQCCRRSKRASPPVSMASSLPITSAPRNRSDA